MEFERRSGIAFGFNGADLETVQEDALLDVHSSAEVRSKGQEHVNVFATFAARKWSRIYLVVAHFDIASVLSNEGEGYLVPLSIWPLRSDDKWKKRKTVRSNRLDEKEQMIGGFGFEAVNSDCHIGGSVERVRQTVIVALCIETIAEGDDTSIKRCYNLC